MIATSIFSAFIAYVIISFIALKLLLNKVLKLQKKFSDEAIELRDNYCEAIKQLLSLINDHPEYIKVSEVLKNQLTAIEIAQMTGDYVKFKN